MKFSPVIFLKLVVLLLVWSFTAKAQTDTIIELEEFTFISRLPVYTSVETLYENGFVPQKLKRLQTEASRLKRFRNAAFPVFRQTKNRLLMWPATRYKMAIRTFFVNAK